MMTDGSASSHGSGGTIERGGGVHGHPDPADSPAPPALPAGAPLWTPDQVRAAIAAAIAHRQSWIAAWGAAWLVRRGHEIDGSTIAWLCEHAPRAALAAMFSRFELGGESRRQPRIARAIAAELGSLEEREPDAAIGAELALVAHLDHLDDSLLDLIERRHWQSIQSFVPALARIRDPRAGALLSRLARSDHDTELRCAALIALARRGDSDAVAAAAPELLALCDEDAGIEGSVPYELTQSIGPDSELDAAMEQLARRLPPASARGGEPRRGKPALDMFGVFAGHGEHCESCEPGCGHSHHAPVHPLHTAAEVGRNDLCPCGSGRKHERCCGK
jgi:hypothetical protein